MVARRSAHEATEVLSPASDVSIILLVLSYKQCRISTDDCICIADDTVRWIQGL